jgi:hypothetical protein
VAEGTGLLNRRMGFFLYRGFESLSLRVVLREDDNDNNDNNNDEEDP